MYKETMKYGLTLEQIEFLLNRKENRTKFEITNNIFNSGFSLLKEEEGIKIYIKNKTDGSKSLCIVFNAGISSGDCWLMWDITEKQRLFMENEFPKIFNEINNFNFKLKQEEYKND